MCMVGSLLFPRSFISPAPTRATPTHNDPRFAMDEERAKPIDIPLKPVKLTSEEETDFHWPAIPHARRNMDEFAQSRGDDDLFADELEPVPEPVLLQAGHSAETAGDISTHKSPAPRNNYANPPPGPRGRGNANDRGRRPRGREGVQGRGEGRGEGRGGQERRGGGGQAASRYATEVASSAPEANKSELQPQAQLSTPGSNDQVSPSTAPASSTDEPPTAQTEPATPTMAAEKPALRTQAVRGDRSATGGPAHKKLTEEELTEKLERMKIINAQKAERFRLSEADSAAFAQKEKEMAEKRAAEQKATRHQDMERAKNRQRKLQAQGGREWDSEKVESDIVDGRGRGRSSEYVRGGHGGVIRGGLAGSRYSSTLQDEANAGQASRGRGGYEGRGRGGRGGRGGRVEPAAATVPTSEDFPSLPTPAKPPMMSAPVVDIKSPIGKGPGDWADEMATPVETKNITV